MSINSNPQIKLHVSITIVKSKHGPLISFSEMIKKKKVMMIPILRLIWIMTRNGKKKRMKKKYQVHGI